MRPPFVSSRRSIASAMILASSFVLGACSVDVNVDGIEQNVSIEPVYDNYERGDALSITVSNPGNDRVVLTTCASELERQIDGDWVRVTFNIDNFTCPDVLYSVGRHESRTFQVDIYSPNRRIPTNIPAGRYRIVLPELREEGSYHSYSKDSRRSQSFWVD